MRGLWILMSAAVAFTAAPALHAGPAVIIPRSSCAPDFSVCQVEAPPVVFTQVTNGTTYHLQDEAFLSWYMHSNFGVNGKYSYLGTFTTPGTLCGPG